MVVGVCAPTFFRRPMMGYMVVKPQRPRRYLVHNVSPYRSLFLDWDDDLGKQLCGSRYGPHHATCYQQMLDTDAHNQDKISDSNNSKNKNSDEDNALTFDVEGFSPSDLQVVEKDGYITVRGHHQDETSQYSLLVSKKLGSNMACGNMKAHISTDGKLLHIVPGDKAISQSSAGEVSTEVSEKGDAKLTPDNQMDCDSTSNNIGSSDIDGDALPCGNGAEIEDEHGEDHVAEDDVLTGDSTGDMTTNVEHVEQQVEHVDGDEAMMKSQNTDQSHIVTDEHEVNKVQRDDVLTDDIVIKFDVDGVSPGEMNLKVVDDVLLLTITTPTTTEVRKHPLDPDTDVNNISSSLRGGILSVVAPLKKTQHVSIPIEIEH